MSARLWHGRAVVAGGFALAAFVALIAVAPARAQQRELLPPDAAVEYRGVGRLNIYGSRFCTATLIDPTHVLTAAHCLYSPITKRLARLHGFVFVAGQYRDGHAADRRVIRMTPLPGFVFSTEADLGNVGRDMALLELDRPISAAEARPFPVAASGGERGGIIVSYAKDRPYAPAIAGPCAPRSVSNGVALLDCAVNSGVSGAPVLAGGAVVGVVSAMARDTGGRDGALTVIAPPRIGELRAALAAEPIVSVAEQDAEKARRERNNN